MKRRVVIFRRGFASAVGRSQLLPELWNRFALRRCRAVGRGNQASGHTGATAHAAMTPDVRGNNLFAANTQRSCSKGHRAAAEGRRRCCSAGARGVAAARRALSARSRGAGGARRSATAGQDAPRASFRALSTTRAMGCRPTFEAIAAIRCVARPLNQDFSPPS